VVWFSTTTIAFNSYLLCINRRYINKVDIMLESINETGGYLYISRRTTNKSNENYNSRAII
jgi:hypothetical protein